MLLDVPVDFEQPTLNNYFCSECEITQRELPLADILLLAKWDVPIGATSRATDQQARIVTLYKIYISYHGLDESLYYQLGHL